MTPRLNAARPAMSPKKKRAVFAELNGIPTNVMTWNPIHQYIAVDIWLSAVLTQRDYNINYPYVKSEEKRFYDAWGEEQHHADDDEDRDDSPDRLQDTSRAMME
jgi:hypothetical protein